METIIIATWVTIAFIWLVWFFISFAVMIEGTKLTFIIGIVSLIVCLGTLRLTNYLHTYLCDTVYQIMFK